jgi:hypothetical protein
MSAGTITTLPTPLTLRPATILRPVPLLSREQRRCLLEELAGDECIGTPHGDAIVTTLLAAFASEALTPADAQAKWGDFISETNRLNAVEAGEPDYRDVCPQMCRSDYEASLNDLLDSTDSYRGTRP